jgi:membrane protease YdiL (CAAX protease family)
VNSSNPERNSELPKAETPADQPAYAESVSGPAGVNPQAEASLPAPIPHFFRWLDLAFLLVFYIVAALMLTAALAILGLTPEALREPTSERVAVVAISQAMHSGAMLAFLYLMVRSRSSAAFWPALGWHALPDTASRSAVVARYMGIGAALLVTVQVANSYLGAESTAPMEELFRDRSSVLMMMALGILVAPLVEETLFRGCIYPVLARTFGIPAGIFLTGALFGLSHALQLGGAWKQVGLLIAVGIFLTYVRARAGTVAASYLVHLGYNTTLFALFYVGTGGLRNFPGS